MAGVVNKSFMEKNLTRLQIFDTRTKEEYDGKIPRMTNPEPGTLCGRLPGAFLWDWRSFYDSEGNVVDRNLFIKRLQSFPFMPERTTVLYDYNGARSCLPALMLKEVGYQDVHTYQGSWFEWRRSSLPKQAVSLFGTETKTTAAPRVGGTDRKKMRKIRKKPLLILYLIESEIKDINKVLDNLMGFSVSVDGDIDSNTHMVKMIVNTVYYQNLLDNLNENCDDEN
jgi:rhodanese-related sulfurtransferase